MDCIVIMFPYSLLRNSRRASEWLQEKCNLKRQSTHPCKALDPRRTNKSCLNHRGYISIGVIKRIYQNPEATKALNHTHKKAPDIGCQH